jgi:hypothetical protein
MGEQPVGLGDHVQEAGVTAAWTQAEAIALCRKIEDVCPAFGCHVALTGGVLYKLGERKDLDILFYRIRQVGEIDVDGLFRALRSLGIEHVSTGSFVAKATYRGRKIDCFFPEELDGEGEYPPPDPEPLGDEVIGG